MNSVRLLKKINESQRVSIRAREDRIFLDCGQLAEILGVSIHTVRKWRQYEEIPYRKFGRSIRYVLDEVLLSFEAKGK